MAMIHTEGAVSLAINGNCLEDNAPLEHLHSPRISARLVTLQFHWQLFELANTSHPRLVTLDYTPLAPSGADRT